MKIPDPDKAESGRRATTVSGVLPRNYKTCCPKCDNSVSGLASGRPARFCVEHPVLDKHQEYYQLIAPRMMLNCELAFHFCEGLYRIPRGELTVPQVHRKPQPEHEQGQKKTGKVCKYCGKPFKGSSNGQLYCSDRCSKDRWNERRRERRAQKRAGDRE